MANEDGVELPTSEFADLSSDEVQTVRDEAKSNSKKVFESVASQIKESYRLRDNFSEWARTVPDNYRVWFQTHKQGHIADDISKAAGQEFDQMSPEIQAGIVYAAITGEAQLIEANVLGAGVPALPQDIIETYREEWPQLQEHFIDDVLSEVSQEHPDAVDVANFVGKNLKYQPTSTSASGEIGGTLSFYNGFKKGDFRSARILENTVVDKIVAARPPSK